MMPEKTNKQIAEEYLEHPLEDEEYEKIVEIWKQTKLSWWDFVMRIEPKVNKQDVYQQK